jgi:hypothetical protein
VQEFGTNAIIQANSASHFLHIGAHLLCEIGDFVDKGYFGREERIGGIFCQFGRAAIGVQNR